MIPVKLDKEECVLVSGSFSREDILALHENPTLLAAKVSYIKNTVTKLYVKGYNTYIFTSHGLFDIMVANIINELNSKGLAVVSVFIKPFPDTFPAKESVLHPDEFVHLSFCFCDRKEDFRQTEFSVYLSENSDCILSPSRVKKNGKFPYTRCSPPTRKYGPAA